LGHELSPEAKLAIANRLAEIESLVEEQIKVIHSSSKEWFPLLLNLGQCTAQWSLNCAAEAWVGLELDPMEFAQQMDRLQDLFDKKTRSRVHYESKRLPGNPEVPKGFRFEVRDEIRRILSDAASHWCYQNNARLLPLGPL
jgi:hypothetical protein